MPTPNKNEKQKDYVARCIPTVMKEGTAKDQKQAAAICFSMWKQHKNKKKSRAEEIMVEVADSLRVNAPAVTSINPKK
jgi:hypothetical protein